MVAFIGISNQLQDSARGVESYILKYTIRIVIHTLIFLYFFKDNVREYFKVLHYSKVKSALIVIGIGIGIGTFGVFSLIT